MRAQEGGGVGLVEDLTVTVTAVIAESVAEMLTAVPVTSSTSVPETVVLDWIVRSE